MASARINSNEPATVSINGQFFQAKKWTLNIPVAAELVRDSSTHDFGAGFLVPRAYAEALLWLSQAAPVVCDPLHDETACKLILAWSKRPHDTFLPLVLADRLDELGFVMEASAWVRDDASYLRQYPERNSTRMMLGLLVVTERGQHASGTRQLRREYHRRWLRALKHGFGDFEAALKHQLC